MDLALALVFGLVIGSFLNVVIVRLPQGKSIVTPRSHCPQCQAAIAWYDNIPLASYLVLGGKCRRCRRPIPRRYPAVEAVTGAVSLLAAQRFGLGPEWVIYLAFSAALIALAVIDMDHRILPDSITLNGIWVGVLCSIYLAQPSGFAARLLRAVGLQLQDPRLIALVASLLGVAVGGGLLWLVGQAFYWIRGIEGMGFGDVKMMAMVGSFLGAPRALLTIMIGSVLGSIIGIAVIRLGGKSRDYELPFGTFLSAAGIVVVLYGNDLVQLYIDRLIRPAL